MERPADNKQNKSWRGRGENKSADKVRLGCTQHYLWTRDDNSFYHHTGDGRKKKMN